MAKVSPSIFSTVNQFFVTSPPLFFLSYYTVSASATMCIPNTVGAAPKYQMMLCHLPSVRRNTLPLVVNLFFGISLPPFLTTNSTLEGWPMSTPTLRTGRRKNAPTFGRFTPTLGGEIFLSLFFVYAAQFLRWGWPSLMQRKRRGFQKRGFGGEGPRRGTF